MPCWSGAIVGSTAAAAVFALPKAGGLRLSPRVGQTLGRAPAEGDVAVVGGLRLSVSEMEHGRITRVGLHLPRTRSPRD
jgi:NhaP-type Na+/H+ and K+/H+ antiporter